MVGILENSMETAGPVSAVVADSSAAVPKRIKRLERPDKAVLDTDVGKVLEQIAAIQARIHSIKELIDAKQQNKQVSSAEVQEARVKLNELTASFHAVMEEKRALRNELDAIDKARDQMRSDLRVLKDKLPFLKVEQIDEEVKRLQYRMSHTSLTLQQEKQLLQQVKELTKSRDFVKEYIERDEQIKREDSARGEIQSKIKEKDAILNDLKAQREKQRSALTEIRANDVSQTVDVPGLIKERSNAFEKIKALREEIKDLKAAFRSKEEEYWERERQWKDQQALLRRKDYEKRDAERKERDKIRKQRELENFVEPYTDEIITVDQLSSYLQKYIPSVEESSSTTPQKAEVVAPKGVGNVIVSKKNKFDEEMDGWFSGKSKGKKAKAQAAPKNKGKEKLSLSLDALTSFSKVKLSAPTTVGDVAKSIEELKSKKEEFVKLQAEARERRERGEPEVATKVEEVEGSGEKAVEKAEEVEAPPENGAKVVENGEKFEKEVNGGEVVEADMEVKVVENHDDGTPIPEADSSLADSSNVEEGFPATVDKAEVVDGERSEEEDVGIASVPEGEKPEQVEESALTKQTTGGTDSKLSEDVEAKLPEDLEA